MGLELESPCCNDPLPTLVAVDSGVLFGGMRRMRGYFGIGIEHVKSEVNVGTLFRSAMILGADFAFTIGRRYPKQSSDTLKSWRHVPFIEYADFDDFYSHLPLECRLVGVEIVPEAKPLAQFTHPERAVYLLGAEDHGLSKRALAKAHFKVVLPGAYCLNVSTAGAIVMYDRITKSAV
jgi:tRNA G18 (ribose-2'-O)-methylase SpoU